MAVEVLSLVSMTHVTNEKQLQNLGPCLESRRHFLAWHADRLTF